MGADGVPVEADGVTVVPIVFERAVNLSMFEAQVGWRTAAANVNSAYQDEHTKSITDGTTLVNSTEESAFLYESIDSDEVVDEIEPGVTVVAAGPAVEVSGTMMVPV